MLMYFVLHQFDCGFFLARSKDVVKGGPRPSNFGNKDNKCFFDKRTIKVCVSWSWRCPGTSPIVGYACQCLYSWRFLRFSVVPEATHEACRGLAKGTALAQKAKGWRRGSWWEEQKRIAFPSRGVIDLTSRQINYFLTYLPPDFWLLAIPLGSSRTLQYVACVTPFHPNLLQSHVESSLSCIVTA